ncbi:MAG TPA: hypothetical protein VFX58_18655, partial [Chitinophagaceae bacterium]|nr:hypothetical protein [Chitinophagaceae bacterium]
ASLFLTSLASCTKESSFRQDQAGNVAGAEISGGNSQTEPKPEVIVIRASGEIDASLNKFRELLGPLNTAPGARGGRREINWDAVPEMFTNNNLFPGNFFASFDVNAPNGRKRGLLSTTPGDGFRISDKDFSDLDSAFTGQFRAFSPEKTFIANGSVITDNFFKVPGTNTDATVQGFGVVFSDVNNAASTSMEFFSGEKSLGSFKVPNNGKNNPGGFSFLGVYFPHEKISRVRIYSGNTPLSSSKEDLAGKDLVIMDDFIYSEPAQ